MKALLIEEPGEIGGRAEVGVGSDARENEEQRGWMVLAIDGHTHFAASFKRRHVISAGETRHMDDLPLRFPSDALAIQDGGRDRRDIRVAKRIFVLFRPDRTPV